MSRKQWFSVALAVILIEIVIILRSELKLHVRSWNGPPVEQLNGYEDGESAESFLRLYWIFCTEHLYPQLSNVPSQFLLDYNSSLCSCVPDTLGMYWYV